MANNKKGGGKLLTGIVCFLLGFIVAIAAEFAVIALGISWLYNSELSTIFDTIGIENTEQDEYTGETSYKWINTDEIKTVSELISEFQSIAGKGTDTLTLNDLSNFPIVDTIVDTVYSAVASALSLTEDEVYELIDEDGLKSTALSEISTYLMDSLGNAKVSTVLKLVGMDSEDVVTLALLYGSEAGTITVDGTIYVIYSEALTASETTPVSYTTSDGDTLPDAYADYIYTANSNNTLYYYVINGTAYVAQRSSSAYTQVYTDESNTALLEYTLYDAATATYSGAYYYNENSELVVLSERTISDLTGDDGLAAAFNDIYLSDLIADTEENKVFMDALGGISVGDLINGSVDINDAMSDVLVSDLLGDDADDVIKEVFDGVTLGELMDGSLDIDEILGKIYVPEVMDVSADNGVMAFIGYSLTNVEAVAGDITVNAETVTYSHTATLHIYTQTEEEVDDGNGGVITEIVETESKYTAYIVTDASGYITNVYYYDNSEITEYRGVTVNDISVQADRLMDTVEIGDMVTFNSDTLLIQKISASTINGISKVIDELTIVDAMDGVAVSDSTVILYIAYGISGFDAATVYATYTDSDGTVYSVYTATYHSYSDDDLAYDKTTVYILADADGSICGLYADSAYSEEITATLVNNVSDRVDGLMNDLPIGDIIDNTSDSVILNAIADSTINDLADNIDRLSIQEVFYSNIYEESAAYGDTVVGSYTVEEYLKVVYESISGGQYYLYEVTTTEVNSEPVVTTTFKSYSGSDIADYISGTKNDKTAGVEYYVYWNDGSGNTIYQVTAYSAEHLYFTADGEYVEYEVDGTSGEYIRGHISSYTAYASEVGGLLYTYGTPQGTWYFMLYSEGVECVYSVDHVEEITQNATDNLENATLSELTEAEILSLDDSQLEVKVSTTYITNADMLAKYQAAGTIVTDGTDSYVLMGDLFLADTISIFINVLNVLSGN